MAPFFWVIIPGTVFQLRGTCWQVWLMMCWKVIKWRKRMTFVMTKAEWGQRKWRFSSMCCILHKRCGNERQLEISLLQNRIEAGIACYLWLCLLSYWIFGNPTVAMKFNYRTLPGFQFCVYSLSVRVSQVPPYQTLSSMSLFTLNLWAFLEKAVITSKR